MVARVPSPAAVPVKRAGSDDRSPRISSNVPTASTSSAEKAQQDNTAAILLPALLPAEPAIAQEESNVQQPFHVSAALSAAPEADQKRSILVKYGDTLEKLALQYLGSRYALNALIDANPQITDINRIYPGQKVYLSPTGHTSPSAAAAARIASQPAASFADDALRTDRSSGPDATSALRTDDR
jgi:LysM repeat protein